MVGWVCMKFSTKRKYYNQLCWVWNNIYIPYDDFKWYWGDLFNSSCNYPSFKTNYIIPVIEFINRNLAEFFKMFFKNVYDFHNFFINHNSSKYLTGNELNTALIRGSYITLSESVYERSFYYLIHIFGIVFVIRTLYRNDKPVSKEIMFVRLIFTESQLYRAKKDFIAKTSSLSWGDI